jgi:ADP-ribose pyrophosphatase YjhB (NUDIX family)
VADRLNFARSPQNLIDVTTEIVRQQAIALLAIAQTGLHYTDNVFERQRFGQVRDAAITLMALVSDGDAEAVRQAVTLDLGHATPKVDVRGAVFDDDGRVLLVRERFDGLWTLPGGWGDVLESPSEAVCREVREESGLTVEAVKLVAVLDREKHPHTPPMPFHIYKFFFLCRKLADGEFDPTETLEVGWFALDALPPLSTSRVLPSQLELLNAHRLNPGLPTEFD